MSPLSLDNAERHEALLSEYRDDEPYNGEQPPRRRLFPVSTTKLTLIHWLAMGLLLVSLAVNISQFCLWFRPLAIRNPQESPSKYAHLSRTNKTPYVYMTEYAAANETVQDEAWMGIDDDLAIVALSDNFADAHELRRAQRFPWDNTKGLYIVHGIHNLHCLKNIYVALREYRRGEQQSRSWHHISHCLDTLRRQIVCDADDTPRATDRRPEIVAGLGQYRMCRSWGELETFAKRHTACYKRPPNSDWDHGKKVDRFKNCPAGSGYVIKNDYIPTDEVMVGLPEENVGYVEGEN